MAHPIKLAENAVNYFISQWLYGLKPSLRLNTDEDGSILITSEVASFPVLSLDDTQYSGNNYKPRRRRSGKSARHRRNLIRNSNVNRDDLFDNSDSDHTPAPAQTAITAVLESSSTQTPGRKELSAVNVVSVDIPPEQSNPQTQLTLDEKFLEDKSNQTFTDEIQCRFCNEKFSCWNNFLNHMKRSNFMCNNCIDYFIEMPWFAGHDLVFIDSDAGVLLHSKDTILDLRRENDHYRLIPTTQF